MKKLPALLLLGILVGGSALAANDAPASDASIREMLDLTNARQLLDNMKGQMNGLMANAMRDAVKNQTVTPERQAILDRMAAKMSTVVTDTMNWDDLMPIYSRTYRASFTQDEIDGVIKFYKSPAGRAYTKKLPVAMQNIMVEMQGLIKPMQEKMAAIQRESIQELKDLQERESKK
ncbi:MAG TPA: DUF2059 domain-containing protein [Steroidobacteraceae bacterium]|nr:DUF2059 domain-containing protein [Steroidobacteraceae bacterium]